MDFRTFEDLEVYKKARELRRRIYEIIKKLPQKERFNLIDQMRRAALSLTNNIAEGHGRYHYQENIQYLRQTRGSLEELMDDLNTCLDEEYIDQAVIGELKKLGNDVRMLLNGYIRYLRKRKVEDNE